MQPCMQPVVEQAHWVTSGALRLCLLLEECILPPGGPASCPESANHLQ